MSAALAERLATGLEAGARTVCTRGFRTASTRVPAGPGTGPERQSAGERWAQAPRRSVLIAPAFWRRCQMMSDADLIRYVSETDCELRWRESRPSPGSLLPALVDHSSLHHELRRCSSIISASGSFSTAIRSAYRPPKPPPDIGRSDPAPSTATVVVDFIACIGVIRKRPCNPGLPGPGSVPRIAAGVGAGRRHESQQAATERHAEGPFPAPPSSARSASALRDIHPTKIVGHQ